MIAKLEFKNPDGQVVFFQQFDARAGKLPIIAIPNGSVLFLHGKDVPFMGPLAIHVTFAPEQVRMPADTH